MSYTFNPFTGNFDVVRNLTFPGTLVIASGKTVTFNHTSTFTTTDGQEYSFPTTSAAMVGGDADSTLTLSSGFMTFRSFGVASLSMGATTLSVGVAGSYTGALRINTADNNAAIITADTINVLALRNGANPTTFNVGNTVTTPMTAGEWFTIDWQTTANVVNLQAVRGSSSGTARVMTLSYGGLKASPVAAITIPITSGNIVFGGGVQLSNAAVTGLVAGAVAALTTATIVLYDSTGQAYRVPCVI